jgi:serine/threonine-protein kinase HipA
MTTSERSRTIYVFAHWGEMSDPIFFGELRATYLRGKEIFSFEYSNDWLKSGYSQIFDPELQMYAGQQFLDNDKNNFGIFLDSSPDRWGRLLMRRRESANARKEKRIERKLLETDYLLGVFDLHRSGGLRFKESFNGPFLNQNKEHSTPPWASIKELEFASMQLEKDDSTEESEYLTWLGLLVAPGSSLGGARPKASIVDNKKQLWIAKFPSRYDDLNIGAWEMVLHELAISAGINVPAARIEKFSAKHHTYLSQRFDRTNKMSRIHFASAMTMLGYQDGVNFNDGVSYLELAEFLMKHSMLPDKDLEELWRRIVFNICVSNTDDHLRNHGFLLTNEGWVLSPAYDMNPVEVSSGLSLNISENDNSLNIGLAIEVAPFFRVSEQKSMKIIDKVISAVNQWKNVASYFKIPRSEQDKMTIAFDIGRKS